MIWIWACAVPSGGEDSSQPAEVTSPTVTVSPEAPSGGEALVAEATGEDLSFSWYRDNALEDDLAGALVPAGTTGRDEVWRVVVQSDVAGTDPASAEVVIQNSPPEVLEVSLADATTEDTLVASAEADDVDGDPVTLRWAWAVDGVEVVGATGSSLGAGAAVRDQVVEVTVTADDGDLEGEPTTASMTVGNALPSVASASLGGTTAAVGTTIEVLTDGWSDPDGDDEGYLYTWYVDGVEVDGEAATFLVDVAAGSVVLAAVTPFDGLDAGEPVWTDAVLVVEDA